MALASQAIRAEFRIVDALQIVRDRLLFVFVMAALIVMLEAMFIFTEQPRYQAHVTIAPAMPLTDPSPTAGAAGLVSAAIFGGPGLFADRDMERNALALLGSRLVTRRFIESEDLLPVFFSDAWDAVNGTWIESDPALQPAINDAVELFENEIRFISRDVRSGLVQVNIEWSDPVLAAQWANALVKVADEMIRKRDIDEATENIRFLRDMVETSTYVSVRQIGYRLIEANTKKAMLARVKESYAFTIIDPAVIPDPGYIVNMSASLKLTFAVVLAFGCSILWVVVVSIASVRKA